MAKFQATKEVNLGDGMVLQEGQTIDLDITATLAASKGLVTICGDLSEDKSALPVQTTIDQRPVESVLASRPVECITGMANIETSNITPIIEIF